MNDIFSILTQFIFAFVSTVGFSIYMNAPVNQLAACGITGAVGWIFYYVLKINSFNSLMSNFIASLVVTIMSERFARKLKKPAILFVIPGILPLVPGLGLYNTMLYLVQGNYALAVSKGIDTLLTSGAIALAVLVVTSIARGVQANKKKIK